jgi:spore maturation protein CgeB
VGNPNYAEKFGTYLPYGVDEELYFPSNLKPKNDAIIIGSPFKQRIEFAQKTGIQLVTNVFRENYRREIQNCKIHVHNHASGGKGLLVMRIWETMSCRVMLLTEEDSTLSRHFISGIHCVTYSSPEDCKEKIEYYIKHDTERERIATAGYNEIIKNHTALCRARKILSDFDG